jgi:hypothetical protein
MLYIGGYESLAVGLIVLGILMWVVGALVKEVSGLAQVGRVVLILGAILFVVILIFG